ncbi:MAG: family 16 glycosylhydrolase [Marinoscillum sp.]
MKYFLLLAFITLFTLISCTEPSDPEPKLPTFSLNDLEVTEKEEDYNVIIDIFLSEASEELILASYTTEDGSAKDGDDYLAVSGQLIFEPGITRQSISIKILKDEKDESEEEFSLILSDAANAIFSDSIATVTILSNETIVDTNELVIPTNGYVSPDSYDGYEMVWSDEFDLESLNLSDWTYEIGNGSSGWGNNELEYYTDQNTSMVDGNLVITAKKESKGGFNYTSSRIITKDKQEFKYGRVDIRAVLPFGQGIWPALWMLGENISTVGWPKCGEIDIMEMIGGSGRESTVHGTVHWESNSGYANYGGGKTLTGATFNDEFHVFSIIWDESSIKWLLDGQQFHVIDITPDHLSEFRNDFFFIFNVAVGGNWPGSPNAQTVFPQYMIVDYIRVFQPQ